MASWRKKAGEVQDCLGSGTFPFNSNERPHPWGGKRGTRPQPHCQAKTHLPLLLHPPPRPCPAFPVNTGTSSGWRGVGVGGWVGGGAGSAGATPGGLPAPHTMAGPGLWLATPHPRPSLGPGEMPSMARAGQSNAPLPLAGRGKLGVVVAPGRTASLQGNAGAPRSSL